ncbi:MULTISPECIES: SIR2 family protein [unclassified Beijerinckia]|uniref:SIR2 family protein n=1 Tax=unclassified Beijerinckia TaxID=2638183 RepID=UPI00089CAF49|nr:MULTISPECIES: SIR2 family protein [unclassified Beijerinckia]MDH7795811.1 hypothetical protein [Beijerinckia sp. GAS462]SEC17394.1 SIR2-like domain-containing protein [Beijerinckia sp. 28-YEA-48]
MLKEKTVLILGAGASKEGNLPTGTELSEQIKVLTSRQGGELPSLLSFFDDHRIREVQDSLLEGCRRISLGLDWSVSIDNFLFTHARNTDILRAGKLAIAHSIMAAESSSYLMYRTEPPRFDNTKEVLASWYHSLAVGLMSGISASDGEASTLFDNLTIIDFNYDRCVEHFLFHTLQWHFDWSEEIAASVMKKLRICHPYGSLGPLPWRDADQGQPFGAANALDASQRIRTFMERMEELPSELRSARQSLSEARNIIFLGFGFHEQNIRLIAPDPLLSNLDRRIYYSNKGLSSTAALDAESLILREWFTDLNLVVFTGGQHADVVRMFQKGFGQPCSTLMSEYRTNFFS